MVVQDDVELTYADMFARAAALAAALTERFEVGRGSRVAVVMGNSADWIVSVLAITAAGGVAALVNSRGVAEEMARAIDTAQCGLSILDQRCAATLGEALRGPHIVIGRDFEEFATPQPGLPFAPVDLSPDEGGVILFTSGTTGLSQGRAAQPRCAGRIRSRSRRSWARCRTLRYEEENGVDAARPERRSMATPGGHPRADVPPRGHHADLPRDQPGHDDPHHEQVERRYRLRHDRAGRHDAACRSFRRCCGTCSARPRATPELLGQGAPTWPTARRALNPALLAEITRADAALPAVEHLWPDRDDRLDLLDQRRRPISTIPVRAAGPRRRVQVQVRRDDGSEAASASRANCGSAAPG